MFSLGALTFMSPWVLSALAVVPALWWLLRVMPPRPRVVAFPALFLLKGLKSDQRTAAHTPWWLLLLRALIVTAFILALADPVRGAGEGLPGSGGAVLIVVDNGWPAAAHWTQRQDKIKDIIREARRAGRAVVLLPTAPAEGGQVRAEGPTDAVRAESLVAGLAPHPWPADDAAALAEAEKIVRAAHVTYSVFASDGTARAGTPALMDYLQREGGGLLVLDDDKINDPYVLKKKEGADALSFALDRPLGGGRAASLSLMAFAEDGGALDAHKTEIGAGAKTAVIAWDMLPDLRRQLARVALRDPPMASATHLTDSRWRQRPAGILSDPMMKENKSVLNEVYYLRRALEDGGSIEIDAPEALMKKTLSAIVWPDSAPVTAAERAALLSWVEAGGFLIRFAGPSLAAEPEDALLPVKLRYGQRSMEGAMTWEKPVRPGGMPEGSPLLGLDVPKDVEVTRQVLADPSPESFEKTWLQLEDGTPLITGSVMGKGAVVLIHTTAGPAWSDFCYSGLYVEALRRMVSLSAGVGDYKASAVLPPLMLMDGFGRLAPPDAHGIAAAVDPAQGFTPSPKTPPGLYGDSRAFRVFNLGDALGPVGKLSGVPSGAETQGYDLSGERSLKADFFKAALLLLLLETLATLALRGVFSWRAAVVVIALLLPSPARADADLAAGIHFAYVETGDAEIDRVSHNGLAGLADILKMRTTVRVRAVHGVDPSIDDLSWYPFLYWPMTGAQGPLSAAAARSLQSYMAEGGMIVFDTGDAQYGDAAGATPGTQALRALTKDLGIPELAVVGGGHILAKSFYLLDEFPGRFSGGKLWAEKEPSQSHDAATSVVIASSDFAAAWTRDPADRERYAVDPGGETQREYAYRAGVNIVMTALAGSYKADQVHVPHILERIGR